MIVSNLWFFISKQINIKQSNLKTNYTYDQLRISICVSPITVVTPQYGDNKKVKIIYMLHLRGYCTPNQKLACFVLYRKIINTFFENKICIL